MLWPGPGLAANTITVTVEPVGICANDGEVRRGDIGAVEVGGTDRDAEGGVGRITGGVPFPQSAQAKATMPTIQTKRRIR